MVAGDKTALRESRAADDATGGDPAAQAHDHAIFFVHPVKSLVLSRCGPTCSGSSADNPFGSRRRGGFYHLAIGTHIGNHDIHTRQGLHGADIEFRVQRVFLYRRMVIDNLPVTVRVSEWT